MRITNFLGIMPKTPDLYLDNYYAQRAHDVDLRRGTLRPWKEKLAVKNMSPSNRTFFVYGCNYYGWDQCVTATPWLPNCPRVYLTGRMPYPEVAPLSDDGQLNYQRLGVPAPRSAVVVSQVNTPVYTKDVESRAYVVTYVNNLGEEGCPSYPSVDVDVNDGQPITVSGWVAPSAEYHITHVRIYRRSTGFRTGAEKEQNIDTEFLFVDEIPVGTKFYVDRVKNMDLGQSVTTREYREPPAGLQQIQSVTGTAILCGFVDNKIYFSRNHQPWNWPLDLELTLDDNIIHIREDDGKLFVSTTGRPYIVDATAACDDRPIRQVVMTDYPYPDIACGTPNGATITPYGMVYPSTDGLVLVTENKAPVLLTEHIFTVDQWRRMQPELSVLAYYKGNIVWSTPYITMMMLIDTNTYSHKAIVTTISDTPIDMLLSSSGELLMLEGGVIYQWDSAPVYRAYEWTSATLHTTTGVWYTSAQVETLGTVAFELSTDLKVFSRAVNSKKSFRLPRMGRSKEHTVKISGTDEVLMVQLGATVNTIGE